MTDPLMRGNGVQVDDALARGRLDRLREMGAAPQGRVPGSKSKGVDLAAARKTAEEFEAVFLAEMMAQMWKGVDTEGLFQGGFAEQTWRQHMIQEYGNLMAKAGGVGVADDVMRRVLQMQGFPYDEADRIVASRRWNEVVMPPQPGEGAPGASAVETGDTPVASLDITPLKAKQAAAAYGRAPAPQTDAPSAPAYWGTVGLE